MGKEIYTGDVVISLAGRDKGEYFLVIGKKENRVFLVNGKSRKVTRPKIKNVKHVQSVLSEELKSLAERINDGFCTGNERVRREIKTAVQIKTGGNVLCRKTT